jgi:hypothetical protein
MSDHRLIQDITNGLRSLLEEEFEKIEPPAPPVPLQIITTPPPDAGTSPDGNLSFWLYHVTENEFVKNQPMLNRAPANGGANGAKHHTTVPPLALNLYYLITPLADPKTLQDQEQLGKAMEVFYDNAIVYLRASDGSLHELRITLCRMTLEEQTRVWDALRHSYRLSVCYQVRVARIDSLRDLTNVRVIEQVTAVGAI